MTRSFANRDTVRSMNESAICWRIAPAFSALRVARRVDERADTAPTEAHLGGARRTEAVAVSGAGGGEPLVVQQPLRDRPALVLLADQVLGGELECRRRTPSRSGRRLPVTARIGSMVRPGVPFSGTAIVESPRCFGASQSVRARHRP